MKSVRAFVLALPLVAACGGQIESGQDGGPSPSSPAQEAGSTGGESGSTTPIGLCPTDPPAVGQSCSSPSEQNCGYINQGAACVVFQCDASGHWQPLAHGC